MPEWNVGNLEGLIPMGAGVAVYLLATGVIPKNPKSPERLEQWRQKWGPAMKVIGPILAVFGLVQLIGLM